MSAGVQRLSVTIKYTKALLYFIIFRQQSRLLLVVFLRSTQVSSSILLWSLSMGTSSRNNAKVLANWCDTVAVLLFIRWQWR